MRNGILVCAPNSNGKNIGDYVQSVAQAQFLSTWDCYVERERLNEFQSKERTNVIMNGWFMWKPQNFPPSDDINPLFVSFHLVPQKAEAFLRPQVIEYLKKYEPIGARDYNTKKILNAHGIESYFSGCLTLTLGRTFKGKHQRGVIFTDPYYPMAGMRLTLYKPKEYVISCWNMFKNFRKALKLQKRFTVEHGTIFHSISETFERVYCAANFYEYYKTSFSDEILFNAEYLTHNINSSLYKNNDEWLDAAHKLVQKYADAKLVITSRIHCALPCLGVETPCIFVTSDSLDKGTLRSGGRFDGLADLLHVVKWTRKGIVGVSAEIKNVLAIGKIGTNTEVSVRMEYRELSNSLNKIVLDFLEKNK